MTTAYREWLTNGMNRIFADVNAARDEALRLAEIGQKSVVALFPTHHGCGVVDEKHGVVHRCGNGSSASQRCRADQGRG